jgi:hypothetical protein
MNILSKLIEKFSSPKKLEERADDVIELYDGFKVIRVDTQAIFTKGDEVVLKILDTLPKSPARAALEAIKILKRRNLLKDEEIEDKKASKEIWTCGFRQAEQRWVWYKNAMPNMTVSFSEMYPTINKESEEDILQKKFAFMSINFGISTIDNIKKDGISVTASKINASVLEKSYTNLICKKCNSEDKYTIDDLVTDKKQASYNACFVVCSNCNELIKLI